MGTNKQKHIKRETIIFDGCEFHRYPFSKHKHLQNYFSGYYKEKKIMLHRVVWQFHNGPIPKGWIVHHIDRNTHNNDISNLQCLSLEDHLGEHKHREFTEKQRKHMDKIRPLASAWLKTPRGKEHCRKLMLNNRAVKIECICAVCGDPYTRTNMSTKKRFICSAKCFAKDRRDSGIDDIMAICIREECKKPYKVNKYAAKKRKNCSYDCANKNKFKKIPSI